MTIGKRLKEERERLGFTVVAFAEAAGSKKHTVIDWQNDVSSPPAARLAMLAEHGVDLLYVLTGSRSQPIVADPEIELSRRERAFWDMYKELDDKDQREIYHDIQEKKRLADLEKYYQENERKKNA
jgi:transcriptional regulator with XRE-family HTH domain